MMQKKFVSCYAGRMNECVSTLKWVLVLNVLVLTFPVAPAHAQLSGSNLKGDNGLKSGSQPDPGFYLSVLYYHYFGDTLRNREGTSIGVDPARQGSLNVNFYSLILSYVTDFKLLGANVGFMVAPSLLDNNLEIPVLDLKNTTSTAFTDLYLQPFVLGWHIKWADFITGLGLYFPWGSYAVGAPNNTGLGMWSFELFAGTTLFFDGKKRWHLATTVFYEAHTEKRTTNTTVGNILTLEGGFGSSFLQGSLNVGVAYYAQWKLTHDDFGLQFELPNGPLLGKHRVFAIGPELTVPVATKKKLYALVTARFLWEIGARTTVEGKTLLFNATFPIPSVRLN